MQNEGCRSRPVFYIRHPPSCIQAVFFSSLLTKVNLTNAVRDLKSAGRHLRLRDMVQSTSTASLDLEHPLKATKRKFCWLRVLPRLAK